MLLAYVRCRIPKYRKQMWGVNKTSSRRYPIYNFQKCVCVGGRGVEDKKRRVELRWKYVLNQAMNMCTHIHRMYNYIIISPFFCFFSFKIQWGVWLWQPLQPPYGSANEVSRPKGGEKTDLIYMYIMLSSCLKILISYGDRKP